MTPQTPPAEPDAATPARVAGGRLIRLLGSGGLLTLTGITAVISYRHGLEVVRAAGTGGLVAYLVPLVADLLILSSSLALLDAAQHDMPRPRLAVWSLVAGIAVTVAMNVAAGLLHSVGDALISAWAPVALVLSYETLMGQVRRARQRAADLTSPAPSGHPAATPGQCEHRVPGWEPVPVDEQVKMAYLHGRDCEGDPPSQRQLSARFDVHRDKVAALVRPLTKQGDEAEPDTVTARPDPAMNGAGGR